MDSRLSDATSVLDSLREAARRGDWQNASALASLLTRQPAPAGREELGQYLHQLKDALAVAKASRAHAAASLVRVKAAAGFQQRLNPSPMRQNFGDAPDS